MPPRTQAALLECMEERQVTSDGTRRPLPSWFTVFATQNPVDFEGTYPLPEAQLDRFLMKIRVAYPSEAEELQILERHHAGTGAGLLDDATIAPITGGIARRGAQTRFAPSASSRSSTDTSSPWRGARASGPPCCWARARVPRSA